MMHKPIDCLASVRACTCSTVRVRHQTLFHHHTYPNAGRIWDDYLIMYLCGPCLNSMAQNVINQHGGQSSNRNQWHMPE